uniref:Ankyrin repeat and MYND domain-containing protein 1 isoform X2 n=1 Tax=Geotrypetes seraphini TaxID=260995 RepID=A0A6P8S9Y0_GEOSA|nr:ankyrin repeat and MYND domain-containing protein 1 isoform X2 [Geotrypetes seraphini]
MDTIKQIVKCSSDVQYIEWEDGSTYKGNFIRDTKTGYGEFIWANREKYTGEFYKDQHHGKGVYSWPDGSKFTGSFYLNRKEGYGTMEVKDIICFQGLHKADERFGPGVETYEDGSTDVGLWFGDHLIKLFTKIPGAFSLVDYPEYHQYVNDEANLMPLDDSITSDTTDETDPFKYSYKELLLNDSYTLPDNIYAYTSNVEHLPLTSSLRKEFDSHFFQDYDKLEEAEDVQYVIKNRTPIMVEMQKHIHRHRYNQTHINWDVTSILNGNRESFGPKGPRELYSELLIMKAGEGDYNCVYEILRDNLAHPDVADANGHTALIAAAANCHYNIINLLLDNGANVNKLNDEGLSALSVSLLRYFPSKSFHSNIAEKSKSEVMDGEDSTLRDEQIKIEAIPQDDIIKTKEQVFQVTELHSDLSVSPKNLKLNVDLSILSPAVPESSGEIKLSPKSEYDIDLVSLGDKSKISFKPSSFDLDNNTFGFDMNICDVGLEKTVDYFSHIPATDQPLEISADEGTGEKMTLSEAQEKQKWSTIKLLLRRGANPNTSNMPMHPLFFAVKTGDVEAVRLLLEKGAASSLHHSSKLGGLSPLHIAVALPGIEGVQITEMLLHSAMNPNERAADESTYPPGKIDMLIKAGANALMPIVIRQESKTAVGTATDYAYYKHFQDKKITQTAYQALSAVDREILNSRKQMLNYMGDLTRETVTKIEKEWLQKPASDIQRADRSKDAEVKGKETPKDIHAEHRPSTFKYCYGCGRSVGVQLTPCPNCKAVYTCSSFCKKKIWNEYHKDECAALKDRLQHSSNIISDKQGSKRQTDERRKERQSTKQMRQDSIDKSSAGTHKTKMMQKGILADDDDDEMDRSSTGSRSARMAHKGIKEKGSSEWSDKDTFGQKMRKESMAREDYEGKKVLQKGAMAKREIEGISKESYSKKAALKGSTTSKGIMGNEEDEEDSKESRSKKMRSKKDEIQGSSRESQSSRMSSKGLMSKTEDEEGIMDSHGKKMAMKGLGAKGETEGSSIGQYGKKGMLAKGETEGSGIGQYGKKMTSKGMLEKGETEGSSIGQYGKKGMLEKGETEGSGIGQYGKKATSKGMLAKGETEGSGIGQYGKRMTPKGMFGKGETERFLMESGKRGRAISAEGGLGLFNKLRMHMKGLMGMEGRGMGYHSKMMEKKEDYTIDNYSFI